MRASPGLARGVLVCLLVVPSSAASAAPESLASALQTGCPTAADFCRQVLYPTTVDPFVAYETHYPRGAKTSTIHEEGTSVLYIVPITTKTAKATLTNTVGKHTTTIEECRPTATCGAVTAPHQNPLKGACTLVLQSSLPTSTFTYSYPTPFVFAYSTTSTTTDLRSTLTSTDRLYSLTTTTVPTKTIYDCITAPAPQETCKNKGLQYAGYDTLDKQDQKRPPLQWNLTHYKTLKPSENGTTTLIGRYYTDYSSRKLRKRRDYGCYFEYSNVRGYLYAPQTGNYTVSVPAYRQAAFIWTGDVAYSGYEVSNALIQAVAPGHENGGGPHTTIHLKRGSFHPIRSAFRCLNVNDYSYYMSIRRPDGIIMFGEYSDYGGTFRSSRFSSSSYGPPGIEEVFSDYLFQFGCGADQKQAPPYPDWGQET